MRWHVHGTDVATGQPVMLAVDEALATDAVQAALSKRIVVSHVTRERLRRALFPLSCAAVVVLIPVCAVLYFYREAGIHQMQVLQKDEARLTAELTDSEANVRDLRAAGASLVDYRAVTAANERVKVLEQQLAAARVQISRDQNLEARLSTMTQSVAATRQQMAQLELNIQEQVKKGQAERAAQDEKRLTEVAAQYQQRLDAMEQANKDLGGQIDTLKSQLLVAAANSVTTAPAPSEEDAAPAGRGGTRVMTRWALRTGYDVTADFVALHFDKETMKVQPQADGTCLWTAMSPANASTMRVVYDSDKRRVYSVAVTVSLAADAPKAKLEENMGLAAQVLKTFAPGVKDAEGRVSRAAAQLANKDESERVVLVGQDTKVSAWNNGAGVFTWRVESLGNEAGE